MKGRKIDFTLDEARRILSGETTPEETKVLAMRGGVYVPKSTPVGRPLAGTPADTRPELLDVEAQTLRGLRRGGCRRV